MGASRSLKERHYLKALEWLRVDPDHPVAEYGTGRGAGLGVLTETLPDGVNVVAMDPVHDHLRRVRERTPPNHSPQRISLVRNEPDSVPVETGVFAGIILAYVLHESDFPRTLLRNLARSLIPRGRLVVLETAPEPPLANPGFQHGIGPCRTRELLTGSGLKPLSHRDLKQRHYLLPARPDGSGTG